MRVTLENIEDSLLPLVSKPNRYLGNFEGACRKDHRRAAARMAIAFPDCFDLGMSHLGIKILYRLVNERDDALAELVFAPWPDMEEKMREHGLPLFTLETRTPISEFDVIGFSLQYELHYTTALNMLDLGGVPVYSKDRDESSPLVIAGGPCAFSPEPMAAFVDAFLVGDGEDAIAPILDLVARRREGALSRGQLIAALAGIDGVYVPSLYNLTPNSLGHLIPTAAGEARQHVRAARIKSITREKTEPAHIVPLIEVIHGRLSVEVMRGCPRSCRFCMPGAVYRPVRRKSEDDVLVELMNGMASGGWEEVSLLSLSTSDYKGITELVADISKLFLGRGVNVSLPSIRPGTLPSQLARSLTFVRKSGLTFAPEAGSERLRRVIGKDITEEEMVESVKVAAMAGWNSIKLYFMVGLPTETMEDVVEIARLVLRLRAAARSAGVKMGLKISVGGFVPKAHTPFQWEPQLGMDEMASRISILNASMRSKGLRLHWRDVETTFLEGLLSRGDRRLAELIHAAWRLGCRFDGWTDQLKFESWKRAIEETGIEPASYLGGRRIDEPQPWSHIGGGYPAEVLHRERERAHSDEPGEEQAQRRAGRKPLQESPSDEPTADKPVGAARVARSEGAGIEPAEQAHLGQAALYGRGRKKTRAPGRATGTCFRVQYEKTEPLRFISHLDVVRAFDRALRRAGLPVAFSEGFSKHPRLAFGPPLAVGMTSAAEYLDIEFKTPQTAAFGEVLSGCLPNGLRVLRIEPQGRVKPESLMSSISQADYGIRMPSCLIDGIMETRPVCSVEEAFRSAEAILAGDDGAVVGAAGDDRRWRAVVQGGSVEWGVEGPELCLSVRLDVRKGPKITEIAADLLAPLQFDPRLLRVKRRAVWVARGAGLIDPFDALDEGSWEVGARVEANRG